MTVDIQTVAENLAELLTSSNNITSKMYDIFLNPEELDVTLQTYNDQNQLITVTIPNRAKDRRIALSGTGSPSGVVSANIGACYVDTAYNSVYFKVSGSGTTDGWKLVLTEDSVQQLLTNYVPTSRTINDKALTTDITLNASDVNALATSTPYGSSLSFSNNNINLVDQNQNIISSVTIGTTGANKDLSNLSATGNAKFQAPITGAATSIVSNNLTSARALVSDSSGKVGVSAVTSTELSYIDGVTSNVQTQLNGTVKTTGNQTVAGVKTFTGNPVMQSNAFGTALTVKRADSANYSSIHFTNSSTDLGYIGISNNSRPIYTASNKSTTTMIVRGAAEGVATGSASVPVYINANGIATVCNSIPTMPVIEYY